MIYGAFACLIMALVSLLVTCFVPDGSFTEGIALGLAATFAVLTLLLAATACFFGSSS